MLLPGGSKLSQLSGWLITRLLVTYVFNFIIECLSHMSITIMLYDKIGLKAKES